MELRNCTKQSKVYYNYSVVQGVFLTHMLLMIIIIVGSKYYLIGPQCHFHGFILIHSSEASITLQIFYTYDTNMHNICFE